MALVHPVGPPHVSPPLIHQLLGPHISFGGYGDIDEQPSGGGQRTPNPIRHPYPNKNRYPPTVTLGPSVPNTGPEAYGIYAPGIDPKQFGVDKSLKPGKAFKGLQAPSGGLGGLGFAGLFGNQDTSGLLQLLMQLGGQGQGQGLITGGIQ